MKLIEFCNKQRRLIAEFERVWILNHMKDPDNWPLDDLWEYEWEEQFQMMDFAREKQIDKLEEDVKQLQSQIQALRTTDREG